MCRHGQAIRKDGKDPSKDTIVRTAMEHAPSVRSGLGHCWGVGETTKGFKRLDGLRPRVLRLAVHVK